METPSPFRLSSDQPWTVRVARADGGAQVYRWAKAQDAERFVKLLGPNLQAVLEGPQSAKAVPRPAARPTTAFALRVAVSARAQLKNLKPAQWSELHAKLAELMALAGAKVPPSRELLEAAGFIPPYLRARAGSQVLVYEADEAARTLTLLHVLKVPKQ